MSFLVENIVNISEIWVLKISRETSKKRDCYENWHGFTRKLLEKGSSTHFDEKHILWVVYQFGWVPSLPDR
jgi:hypothetical protein